jgi:RNA polymerase sigma-70 factor, ECF subfamily
MERFVPTEHIPFAFDRATCQALPKTETKGRQGRGSTGISREDETQLVARVMAGDQSACAKVVALFGPRMLAVARRFMRCEDDCNDAVQDAFIRAFKSFPRFEAGSRLSTWLHRITVNSCLMKLRADSSRKEFSMNEPLPGVGGRSRCRFIPAATPDPLALVEIDEACVAVRRAIERLPERYRMAIVLRDIEEKDTVATAEILTTTENNVKHRLRRARKVLRTLLDPAMT